MRQEPDIDEVQSGDVVTQIEEEVMPGTLLVDVCSQG